MLWKHWQRLLPPPLLPDDKRYVEQNMLAYLPCGRCACMLPRVCSVSIQFVVGRIVSATGSSSGASNDSVDLGHGGTATGSGTGVADSTLGSIGPQADVNSTTSASSFGSSSVPVAGSTVNSSYVLQMVQSVLGDMAVALQTWTVLPDGACLVSVSATPLRGQVGVSDEALVGRLQASPSLNLTVANVARQPGELNRLLQACESESRVGVGRPPITLESNLIVVFVHL